VREFLLRNESTAAVGWIPVITRVAASNLSIDKDMQEKGKRIASTKGESETNRQRQEDTSMMMKLEVEVNPTNILVIDSTEDRLFL